MTASFLKSPIFLLALATPVFAQGPLDPPSGVPSPTMKTLQEVFDEVKDLDQIEARTPISSLPFTINTPGSYFLTANLTSVNSGIIITSSNVNLDLNGFNLTGSSSNSNHIGIQAASGSIATLANISVKNGSIQGFGNSIQFILTNNSLISDILLTNSGATGINISAGTGNIIQNCSITGAELNGISLEASSAACIGNTITNCSVSDSGSNGILINGSFGTSDGNTVRKCTVSNSDNNGIFLLGATGQCNGNTISECSITNSGRRGISLTGTSGICNHNRIIGNHISGFTSAPPTYGIVSNDITLGNLVIKNFCFGASDNFSLDSDDTYGPEITAAGAISTTNPWANFSH